MATVSGFLTVGFSFIPETLKEEPTVRTALTVATRLRYVARAMAVPAMTGRAGAYTQPLGPVLPHP